MGHVLSLIAAASKSPLSAGDVDVAQRALRTAGAEPGDAAWLAPSEACEVPFQGDASAALAAVRAALGGRRPFDINILPAAGRRKRLLLADMDSTLIEQECVDELAAEIGKREEIAAITERAMRGELEFEPALRERVAMLRGLSTAVSERLIAERIAIMPGAATLVATMRAHGAHAALVSGGFTSFAGPIAQKLGFDEFRANTLLFEADAFTGSLAEPILGREAKVEALNEIAARLAIAPADVLAVGDGANDLGMIRLAGLGVAYRAKPMLRQAADASVEHGDLTGLLFLQGYRREEFVERA
jgi:phosphoserine phosphatase